MINGEETFYAIDRVKVYEMTHLGDSCSPNLELEVSCENVEIMLNGFDKTGKRSIRFVNNDAIPATSSDGIQRTTTLKKIADYVYSKYDMSNAQLIVTLESAYLGAILHYDTHEGWTFHAFTNGYA